MAHCTKCGAQVDSVAQFCQSCGERQPSGGASPTTQNPTDPVAQAFAQGAGDSAPTGPPGTAETGPGARSGLQENIAAALSYAAVWVTGIIFLLIDKRPFVQFHAAQSLVVFGALWFFRMVLSMAVGANLAFGGWRDPDMWGNWRFGRGAIAYGMVGLLSGLLGLAMFVLWVLLMVKAYQGERFRIPIAADLAETMVGK